MTDDPSDKRRFPRIDHVSSQQIIRLESDQTPKKNLILTKNVSASGIRFSTPEKLIPDSHFLLYLNRAVLTEIDKDPTGWVRSGDYYLTKVVWIQKIPDSSLYEVGAAFLEKAACRFEDIQKLTELLNVSVLESLSAQTQI